MKKTKEKEEKVKEEGTFKAKKKSSMKKLNKKNEPIKVDLSKNKTDAIPESKPVLVDEKKQAENVQKVDEGTSGTEVSPIAKEETKQEETGKKEEVAETPTISEITEEEFEPIGETSP